MLRNAVLVCLLALVGLALAGPANAGLIDFSGTFSRTFVGLGVSISGTFGFQFNDSGVTTGFQTFSNLPLSSLTLNPNPIGGTTFTTSNTGAEVTYINGTLFQIAVGGLISGIASMNIGTEDFRAIFSISSPTTPDVGFAQGIPVGGNGTGSLTITSVPEPGAFWLLGASLIALGLARRHRKRAAP